MSRKDRKPTFFTADWHLGHKRSIDFDERPFKDLDHMHTTLINNYNSTVPENGICYFLGDISMLSVDKTKEIIDQLNGTKILILGNHDGTTTKMYHCGFDAVMYGATLYIAGQRVSLTHCPLRGIFREDISGMPKCPPNSNWHGEHKNQKFSCTPEKETQFHIHGHIHARRGRSISEIKTNRQFDVGVPGNNYRPVSEKYIESQIQKILYKESRNE